MIRPPDDELVGRFRHDLATLAGTLDGDQRFALAVSGGGDSFALLLLASAALPGCVAAASVDHRLRPEAEAECAFVGAICATLGVHHATLTAGAPPSGNIQSAARSLRYGLLAEWARAHGCAALLTAHQLDDQAETLLMRLRRGSGVAGLAGIRPSRPVDVPSAGELTLLRPLLGWRRAELAAIVAAAGIEPARDPANSDTRFDRTRMRAVIAGADWLDPPALARSAAALADAEDALAWSAAREAGVRFARAGELLRLDPQGLPVELLRRLVIHAIGEVDPSALPLRGDAVERLIGRLRAGEQAMLGNVLARPGPLWTFELAPARRSG